MLFRSKESPRGGLLCGYPRGIILGDKGAVSMKKSGAKIAVRVLCVVLAAGFLVVAVVVPLVS